MANSLNADLTGRVVVLDARVHNPQYRDLRDLLFKVEGGFGASAETRGTGLLGVYVADGERARRSGYDVARFATEAEVQEARQP